MTAPSRRRRPELMDHPAVDASELARSLRDLEGVNRWLGGTHVAVSALAPLLRPLEGREVHVLDVATGSADIPLALARRARARGARVRVLATDAHPATVALARARVRGDPDVEVQTADALALPFADRSFDFATCNTALHHFDAGGAVQLLRELGRVARRSVVVTDLTRSWVGLAGVRILAATVWRGHPVTRHDGPVSVRAAYTPAELRALAHEAGLRAPRVTSYFFFNRMALVAAP